VFLYRFHNLDTSSTTVALPAAANTPVINRISVTAFWHQACMPQVMAERILIIDDDDQLMTVYKEHFTEMGYQVDCARELEEAQTLLAFFPYSVILTDLRLSKLGFDGLALVKHVRELALPTRIVVLTGYGWPEIKAEARAHGVDAFIQKPTRLSTLAETIHSVTEVQP
jgi:DNA-binding NtrC family response regulator